MAEATHSVNANVSPWSENFRVFVVLVKGRCDITEVHFYQSSSKAGCAMSWLSDKNSPYVLFASQVLELSTIMTPPCQWILDAVFFR